MESTKPAKAGKLWTNEDTTTLLTSIQNNVSIETIALYLERSVKSIECKLKMIAVEMYSKNTPFEEIEKITKFTPSDIEEAIEWKKQQQQQKHSEKRVGKPQTKKQAIIDLLKDVQEIQRKLMALLEAD